ncbi:MAG: transporter [Bacteroidetes bacterium]|nr:MAG: transporter [Bacteroidota bacterium]
MKNFVYVLFGLLFGFVITKAEVISWFRIQSMFRFEEWHMYLVIGSAVAVGALSVQLLKRSGARSLAGEELDYKGKTFHKGFIYGGVIFGIGWAVTGACPGPIFAQIGAGETPALATLAGALVGAYLYHANKSRLPH